MYKQRPYMFNVDDTWYELRCPCCHKTLDTFHSESLFDEKSCKYCGVELEKSDYQNAYDLQLEQANYDWEKDVINSLLNENEELKEKLKKHT